MCRAKGHLGYRDRPLVGTDFEASPSSGTFLTKAVIMLELTFVEVVPWYTCKLDHSFRVVVLMVQVKITWAVATGPWCERASRCYRRHLRYRDGHLAGADLHEGGALVCHKLGYSFRVVSLMCHASVGV